jgi:hypothetical protein
LNLVTSRRSQDEHMEALMLQVAEMKKQLDAR